MIEVELKLAIAPGDVPALRRAAPLAGTRSRRRKLTSIYYDTPECELARAGIALRLRRAGGRWTQTMKGPGSGTGGLHARAEFEAARPDATLDLGALPREALQAVVNPSGIADRLRAAFTVEVRRETWELKPAPGTRLEVALDRGEARANGRVDAVCEVEIEVLEGDRQAVFDLARALLAAVPMRPSAVTKAQRGYLLLRREPIRAAKAKSVDLSPGMAVADAARAVVSAALDQLQSNEEGVLATEEPELVHQARVGLRRMRSALRMFRDAVPEAAEGWRKGLSEIAGVLGAARDWDVFATESLPPLAKAFGDPTLTEVVTKRVEAPRQQARQAARAALRSREYSLLILEISQWLTANFAPGPPPATPLADFATRLVRKRHKRLVADARTLATRGAEERHAVRIDAKRLRYALDGLASVFKGKPVRRYQAALAGLQDLLGAANDAVTAARLLAELAPPADFNAFARGWLAARADGEPALASSLVAELEDAKPFRRRKKT